MYGCTDKVMGDTKLWLERCGGSALHPLVLPMVFAEHERKRLFNAIDEKSTELEERILELETRVKKGKHRKKGQKILPMAYRDCEAIDLWRSMSSLKNGLESLHTELGSMREHLHAMLESLPKHNPDSGDLRGLGQGPDVYIDARLKEMMAEFQSKIRNCEGLLGSMTLATQMVLPMPSSPLFPLPDQTDLTTHKEWNYYTRHDAKVSLSIATETKMDGSQMKQISLLGMTFLPGTFLAVSDAPPSSRFIADTGPDFLFNDLLQLDTGRKCSTDLAVACSLCRAYLAADIRGLFLVQVLGEASIERRNEKSPGRT